MQDPVVFSYRLSAARVVAWGLPPLLLLGVLVWWLCRPGALADAPFLRGVSLPLLSLALALCLLWGVWLLGLRRRGRLTLTDVGLQIEGGLGWRWRQALLPYGQIRGIHRRRTAGQPWLEVRHGRGVLALPQAMLAAPRDFELLRRALIEQVKAAHRRAKALNGKGDGIHADADPQASLAIAQAAALRALPPLPPYRPKRRAVAVLMTAGVLAWLVFWAVRGLLPTAAGFEHAVRELIASERVLGGSRHWDDAGEAERVQPALQKMCLQLDDFPAAQVRPSSARRLDSSGMAWFEDHIDPAERPPQLRESIAAMAAKRRNSARRTEQLRALAQAGVLESEAVPVLWQGRAYQGTRYRMSVQGWASGWSRAPGCIAIGMRRFAGVSTWQVPKDDRYAALWGTHTVTYRTQVPQSERPEWTRHAQVQQEFGEQIHKAWADEDKQLALARSLTGWQTPEKMIYDHARGQKSLSVHAQLAWQALRSRAMLLWWDVRYGQPDAGEIRQMLEYKYGADAPGASHVGCIPLPGGSGWMVDQTHKYGEPYQAVIFAKERGENDPLRPSIAYLQKLVAAGILWVQREPVQVERGPQKGQLLPADVYRMGKVVPTTDSTSQRSCLPLGKPQAQLVALQVVPAGNSKSLEPRFRFRLQQTFPEPGSWARNPRLQAAWPELREAITRGRFCEGEFGYDLKKKDSFGGASSCFWGVDWSGGG